MKQISRFQPKSFLPFEITCLLLVTVAVYFGTLDHTFHFDDKQNIWNNSFLHISSISYDELKRVAKDGNIAARPVANISFALNYYFNGLEVRGYHMVNILIHLIAGIALFFFVRATMRIPVVRDRYGPARFIPFFTALIWLAHPIQTQSVTYIVQRMSSMAAMFYIMAMLFYVLARMNPNKAKKVLFFLLCFMAGLLAFGTKENAVTLPLFIFLYEWCFFQECRLKISRRQFCWLVSMGAAFVCILYLFLGSSPLTKLTAGYGSRIFTLSQRLLTEPRVVLHYISLLVYPHPGRLNLDYDFPLSYSLVSPMTTLLSILMIVGVVGIALYISRKNQLYSFCILWFFGNLLIESSIIPLEIVYEHRTYLPSMSAILLLVLFSYQLTQKKRIVWGCLLAIVLLFSYWTLERNKVWENELTLWSDTQKKSPEKARTNQNLGTAYLAVDKVDEAIIVFQKALQLYMEEIKLQQHVSSRLTSFHLRNLGSAYKKKGEYQKAIIYLERALVEFSFDAETHFFLGYCYSRVWRLPEAIQHFSTALKYSQHHSADLAMQANVANIRVSLEKAKQMLKYQEQRKEMLKK